MTIPRRKRRRKASSWRDVLPIHPAADLLPRLSDDELRELGEDIKKHGLKHPVTLWRDGGRLCLLDGINRLDAMERADIVLVNENGELPAEYIEVLAGEIDPYAYVISANIRRRHLTTEQTRELIVKLIKATPEKSNRQIAKIVKASHPHVAKVRQQAEKAGDVETVTTSIDTKGRRQPARKPARRKNPTESRKQAARQAAKRAAAALAESEVDEVARLRARIRELEAEVDQLKRENLDLQSEVGELRARPGMRRPRRMSRWTQ